MYLSGGNRSCFLRDSVGNLVTFFCRKQETRLGVIIFCIADFPSSNICIKVLKIQYD